MLNIDELEAIKAALVELSAGRPADISALLASLTWAIEAERDIQEIKEGGGFKCAASYRRITSAQERRKSRLAASVG
jgi:hypothetical protein